MGRYSEEVMEQVRRRNYQRWLQNAGKRHDDLFSYRLAAVDFRKQKEPKVWIICREHGKFKVSPYHHLRSDGGGCKECGLSARGSSKIKFHAAAFMKFFKDNLSDRLELLTEYCGVKEDVTVRCRRHGTETQVTPDRLMHGGAHGCDECAAEAIRAALILKIDDVLADFDGKFEEHIQITDVQFDGEQSKIRVECERHGAKWVTKGHLTRSDYGCPDCGSEVVGYAGYRYRQLLESGSAGRETWLYVVEVEAYGIKALKVGITTRTLEARYGPDLKTIHFRGKLREIDALRLENVIKQRFEHHSDPRITKAGMREGKHWSGHTECYFFREREAIIASIKEGLVGLKRKAPDYWAALEAFERPDFNIRQVGREKDLTHEPQPVVCVETGEWFRTQTNAARKMRTTQGNISLVLSGKRRVAGGKHWVRAEDYDAGDAEDL